jgi:hypothetical protein
MLSQRKPAVLIGLLALAICATIMSGRAAAGYPDLANIVPKLTTIEFRGTDVLFDGEYAIPGSKWEAWSGRNIEIERGWRGQRRRGVGCVLPPGIKERYREPYETPQEILCDGDRIWFATESYCSEGIFTQGDLFSYLSSSGEVEEYKGLIPDCEAIAAAVRVHDERWFALVRPGEHGPYGGSGILIYDTRTKKGRVTRPEGFTSGVPLAIAFNPADQSVWLTTKWGIDRYSTKTKTWEHRYIKPILTDDERFTTTLVAEKPPLSHYGMISHLIALPIQDRRGFADTWNSLGIRIPDPEMWIPIVRKELLPYYIDALDRITHDGSFNNLLGALAHFKGGEDEVRAFLERYNDRPMSDKRRRTIMTLREQFGLGDAEAEKDQYFASLKTKFFEQRQGRKELCDFIRQNDKYVPQMVEQVAKLDVEGPIAEDVLSCVNKPWYKGAFFESMRPFVIRALQANDPGILSTACELTRRYVFTEAELKGVVRGLLRAASVTQHQIRTVEDGKICWMTHHHLHALCLDAAHEIANSQVAMDILVSELEQDPETAPTGLMIASCMAGQAFETVRQSTTWWAQNRDRFKPLRIVGISENFIGVEASGACRLAGPLGAETPPAKPRDPGAKYAAASLQVVTEQDASRPSKPQCYPGQPPERTRRYRPNRFDLTK